MLSFAIRRVLLGLLVLFLIASFVFFAFRMVPGDIVSQQLEEAGAITPELLAEKRAQLGLDKPVVVQFTRWVAALAQGDMGQSLWSNRPVAGEIARAIVPTLQLAVTALVLGAILGVASGMGSALRRGTGVDVLLRVGSTLFLAIPHLWLGLLTLTGLAAVGYYIPLPYRGFFADPFANMQQILIPAAAMSLGLAAALSRLARSAMLEVISTDFIRAAHARGVSPARVYLAHGLKNALIPVLTLLGIQFASLLSGTVIIERIFNIPGLGNLLFQAVGNRDYPLIQAVVLVYGTLTITVNLVVDLSYGLIDPRIRESRT